MCENKNYMLFQSLPTRERELKHRLGELLRAHERRSLHGSVN